MAGKKWWGILMSLLNHALSSVHPSSVEGMRRIKSLNSAPLKLVRDIRIELMTPTWKDGVLPLYKSRENGGQSGERSQRAFKRRIYSPNRLLNGIPTH